MVKENKDRFESVKVGLEWQFKKEIAEQLKRIADSLEKIANEEEPEIRENMPGPFKRMKCYTN